MCRWCLGTSFVAHAANAAAKSRLPIDQNIMQHSKMLCQPTTKDQATQQGLSMHYTLRLGIVTCTINFQLTLAAAAAVAAL